LAFCGVTNGQIIDFPDARFKNALVNTYCVDLDGDGIGDADADLNDDGEIDVSEALQVDSLKIINSNIFDINPISKFENLVYLNCYGNELDSLNLVNLDKLEFLDCGKNKCKKITFPDKNILSTLRCPSNMLKDLDVSGLKLLKHFSCSNNELNKIEIDSLYNLISLDCSSNKITSLNTTNLTNLENLYCFYNNLTELNLNNLIKLQRLNCASNKISYLNVEQLHNLWDLQCSLNEMKTLIVTGLNNLSVLNFTINKISHINLNDLNSLTKLYCGNNQLSEIDLTGLNNLIEIVCSNNKLTSLNATKSHNLQNVRIEDNQLNSLFIKNGASINNIDFYNNPNLSYICCNEIDFNEILMQTIENSQSYCVVNSYCTFTPGGKFYIIQGNNTFDGNINGCDDEDIKQPNFKYNITDGISSGSIITNSMGNYSIPVQEGTHTITPILENPDHFEVTPSSITVTFPSTSDTITQDFCITPKGILRQTNITVIPLSPPARPGFDAKYKIVWENAGNQIESGTLNFTYDETLLDYISATQTADQVADGIIKWNFTNLLPFEKREITVTLKVNRPTDTPAVNAGDKLYLTASILDNIFTLENTVVGSYDPNDKTCLQGDRVKPDMVGEYVDYLIRFENTGNYAAENVVVKDIIDTKTFDVNTLKITDSSHEVYTRIEGNKVEFIFENIQLPFDDANNDGYIAFKIKTLPTLVLGDSLKNLADIYFDYNFPIRTNEAQTTVAFPVFTKDITTGVNIYPNPVSDVLYLDSNDHWSKAEIFDIAGRIMRSISLDSSSMDVSGLESGTYFIRLKHGEKVGLVKFVKI